MTVDEAVRDLLSVSTDIRRLAVLDAGGEVLGGGPGAAGPAVPPALEALWREAQDAAGPTPLEHVVVDLGDATVVALQAGRHRAVALTEPQPPVGLVLFDLRTCLADAFPEDDAEGADRTHGGPGAAESAGSRTAGAVGQDGAAEAGP